MVHGWFHSVPVTILGGGYSGLLLRMRKLSLRGVKSSAQSHTTNKMGLTLAGLKSSPSLISTPAPHSFFSKLICSIFQEEKLTVGSRMTFSVSLNKSASARSQEPRKGPPVWSALPPPSVLAGPSGFVLMPYEHTCRHWVEVTRHSPLGTGDERGSLSSQGSMSHPRR